MIYLDTSVLLAQVLVEDHRVPEALWSRPLISSRLIEYETWVRLHALGRAASHGDAAASLLARISKVELASTVLERALEPFPAPVRTLDALHLATALHVRAQRIEVQVATLDRRFAAAAAAAGLDLIDA